MKQRDALEIFSFKNYYGAHTTTVLLNASNSVKYAVKTADIVKQHKRVETLLERDSIDDLTTAQGRLVHLRDNEVVLFKVARSNYWQARFRIYTGKWIRFSTRRRNLDDARQIACDRYDEARYRERLGFTPLVKRFDEMAKCCVAEMRRDIAAGTGKKIYTAYIAVIETYLIPFFGQMYLTSITNRHIAEFEVWRNSQLRRPPKVSTLLTFASAFTRITQTAVEQGWISDKVPVPKLNVRGEKGQARPAFTNDEVARIQQHLLTWYVGVEGYTGEMRLMLRDLVDILILTGMRQGTESMNLEWRHIEWYVEKDVRYLRIWVSGKTGARWLIAKHECLRVLERLQATHDDTADLSFDDLLALRMPTKLFRFKDGRKPFEMNKIFRRLLEDLDLVKGQAGTDRTLYSLRHTYATQELFVEWHPKLSHFEENLHPNLSHPNRLSCLIFEQGWARSDQRGNFEQITQTCPSRQGLHPTS